MASDHTSNVSDLEYYRTRRDRELQLAEISDDPAAAFIHRDLARLYDVFIEKFMPGQPLSANEARRRD